MPCRRFDFFFAPADFAALLPGGHTTFGLSFALRFLATGRFMRLRFVALAPGMVFFDLFAAARPTLSPILDSVPWRHARRQILQYATIGRSVRRHWF
jgi:hypothetical protein